MFRPGNRATDLQVSTGEPDERPHPVVNMVFRPQSTRHSRHYRHDRITFAVYKRVNSHTRTWPNVAPGLPTNRQQAKTTCLLEMLVPLSYGRHTLCCVTKAFCTRLFGRQANQTSTLASDFGGGRNVGLVGTVIVSDILTECDMDKFITSGVAQKGRAGRRLR